MLSARLAELEAQLFAGVFAEESAFSSREQQILRFAQDDKKTLRKCHWYVSPLCQQPLIDMHSSKQSAKAVAVKPSRTKVRIIFFMS